MMTENDKICPLGLGECTSSKNKESCQSKFYKCNKVNTSKYYLDCIEKFLSDPDIIYIGEKKFRTDFGAMDNRSQPDCRVVSGKPRKPMGKEKKPTDSDPENNDEDFICRCYYRCYNGKCNEKCGRRFDAPVNSEYKVIDYQIPLLNDKVNSCGKVDIVLRKDGENKIYLTEVKPPKGNNETLLRMILEILTYSQYLVDNDEFKKYCNTKHGVNAPEILPAIMFFIGTLQEKEYYKRKKYKEHKKDIDEKISEIIKKYNISVFSCNERTKAITKLN